MTDWLHGLLYLFPGLTALVLAGTFRRLARRWIATIALASAGDPSGPRRGPTWARRWVAGATIVLGAAGAGLVVLGAALAAIILR